MKKEKVNKETGHLEKRVRDGKYVFIVFIGMIVATILSIIIAIVMLITGEHSPFEGDVAFALMTLPAMETLGFLHSTVIPHLILRFIHEESKDLFLNGDSVWQYFSTRLFPRMSKYVGYELGDEAAALMMLTLKSYKRSTLEIGYVETQSNELQLRAWVQVEFLGDYWVIDPFSEPDLVTSWGNHRSRNRLRIERMITHAEFWRHPIVQDFYRLISIPETSFIFNKMIIFENFGEPNYRLGFEEVGYDSLNDNGRQSDLIWLTAFGADKPVDALLVVRMIEREVAEGPKRHHYRKLMRLAKTRQAAVDAALEYEKKTGVTPTVCFESLTKFSLMANGKVVS